MELGTSLQLCCREDILACLPENKRLYKIPKAVPVAAQAAREGTGRFDTMDDRTLVVILNLLPLEKRLLVAMCVCKSWRVLREVQPSSSRDRSSVIRRTNKRYEFRGQVPALWSHIDITYSSVFTKGDCLSKFIQWLPDPAAITHFEMYTGGTFHLDVLKRVLKVLPSLTTLALTGKKVTNQCASFVAKLPFAANLTSVTLLSSKVTAEGAVSLLGAASQLYSLTIHSSVFSEFFVRQLSSRLRQARQGGFPLLSRLSIQDG